MPVLTTAEKALYDSALQPGGTLTGAVAATATVDGTAANTVRTGAAAGATAVQPARAIVAGAGLTGGGDLSADRTVNVVANADASIVVNANDIQVSAGIQSGASAGATALQPGGNLTGQVNGVAVATVTSGAALGATALQPGGNLTGQVNGVAVATVTSGAAAGATALQPATAISVTALTVTQAVATSGSPAAVTVTGAAHTTLAASTEAPDVVLNLARTVQFSTGAFAIGNPARAVKIQAPTYAAVAASTIAVAATVAISGAPIAGANATITTPLALYVESGSIGVNHAQKIVGKNNAGTAFLDVLDWGTAAANRITVGNTTGDLYCNAAANFIWQIAGTTKFSVTASTVAIGNSITDLTFALVTVAPRISQLVDTTASVTCDTLTIKAQNGSGTTAVTAGDLALEAGDATGASGIRNGGTSYLKAGSGATANGEAQLRNAAGTPVVRANSTGLAFFNAAPVAQPADVGAPSFTLIADAQTWCASLRTSVVRALGLTA